MQPGERKRASFGGGSLLGPVKPIPDDDVPTAEPDPTPPTVSEPEEEQPSVVPARAPQIDAERAERVRRRGGRPMARRRRGIEDEGPATIRLDEGAKAALWESFVRAKQQDPFLTYTEHASAIVMDGIDRERRRGR
jgi:hypothetical protein